MNVNALLVDTLDSLLPTADGVYKGAATEYIVFNYKTRATSLIHKLIALNYHRRILFTEFFSHTPQRRKHTLLNF